MSSTSPMPTPLATPCPTVGRSGRPPNSAYIELMKPNEDWRKMDDAAERRKIQNRLAQRAYRRNLRDRNKEVEMLKKQVKRLKEAGGNNHIVRQKSRSVSPAASVEDFGNTSESSVEPSSSRCSDQMNSETFPFELSEPEVSNDMNFMYFDFSNASSDSESMSMRGSPSLHGLGPDGPKSDNMQDGCAGLLGVPSPPPSLRGHQRSGSIHSLDSRAQSFSSQDMELLPFPFPAPQQEPFQFEYYASPKIEPMIPGSLPADDNLSLMRAQSSPLPDMGAFQPGSAEQMKETAAGQWQPDANASLLHFAVAGGQIDTLRLLLQHSSHLTHVRDSHGYTPIQCAIMMGRTDMVALFLEHGASLSSQDMI